MSRKAIVITGCSSGFGRATAIELAKQNWHVFATVRKTGDQENLLAEARKLGHEYAITPLLCDITSAEQVALLREEVTDALRTEQNTTEIPRL
ncbi:MAG TPA: SDR family NAD(P)-dependent oxidoreductase, partial [Ktedonobacteraceae bacterium]